MCMCALREGWILLHDMHAFNVIRAGCGGNEVSPFRDRGLPEMEMWIFFLFKLILPSRSRRFLAFNSTIFSQPSPFSSASWLQ